MNSPTPRDAVPNTQRRQELVEQVLDSLDGVDALPTSARTAALNQAQSTLSAILNNTGDVAQMSIPGVHDGP